MRPSIAVAVACLAVASCRGQEAQEPGPPADTSTPVRRELKVGDPAPPFSLPGSDGRVYALDQYRGRQTVVLAWFAKAFSDG